LSGTSSINFIASSFLPNAIFIQTSSNILGNSYRFNFYLIFHLCKYFYTSYLLYYVKFSHDFVKTWTLIGNFGTIIVTVHTLPSKRPLPIADCAKFQVIPMYTANIQHNEYYCVNHKLMCCKYGMNWNKSRKIRALIEILHIFTLILEFARIIHIMTNESVIFTCRSLVSQIILPVSG